MMRGFTRAMAARVGAGDGVDREAEQGFMLVGLIVAIFLILLVLSIAAPRVAKELQREREVEAVHRANQYVRAIQLYYRKNGTYPASLDVLEKSNNIRFLRQRYLDPMTGKADWRLIHVGEAKTTVKGFFGQPLAGLAPGLGAAAGMASSGGIGAGAAGSNTGSSSAFGASSSGSAFGSSTAGSSGGSAFGSSSGSAFGSSTGSSAFGSSTPTGATGQSGASGSTAGGATTGSGGSGTSSGSSSGITSQSATSFTGGGAPFVGIGVPKEGDAIVVVNEQTTYQTWEFLYDPRIDQMKSKASLFGGGPASASATGLGTANSMSSGVGGTGNTSGSAFGSSSSGFGSSSGSGFGSSPSGSGTNGSGNSGTGSSGNPTPPQ
jgi:type II secretory pathway pseudopilin PulG